MKKKFVVLSKSMFNEVLRCQTLRSEVINFSLWKVTYSLNVDREVLFIEVSLKCYPEDIFSFCKVWQLQRWENFRLKNCLSCTKQKLAGLKTVGLVGLWAFFEDSFFLCFGGKKKSNFFTNIEVSALKSCIKWSWKKNWKFIENLIMNF